MMSPKARTSPKPLGGFTAQTPFIMAAGEMKWCNKLRWDDLASTLQDRKLRATCSTRLLRATGNVIVRNMDCGGALPQFVAYEVLGDFPFSSRCGEILIRKLALNLMHAEILPLSRRFQALFNAYNRRYFSGGLPNYRVRVVFDLHSFAKEPICASEVSDGLIRRRQRCIYLRYTDFLMMKATLLHEMAHAATRGGHGPEWQSEIQRLAKAGAPVAPWEVEPCGRNAAGPELNGKKRGAPGRKRGKN